LPEELGPPTRQPLRRDAERNRERILAAARRLISERGIAISHDEIARAADVGVGTVYRRFPTLAQLFDELFCEQLDRMVSSAEAASQLDDPLAGLRQFLEQYFEQQAANRGLGELLIGHRGGTELSRRAQDRLRPLVENLVTRAQERGQLHPAVDATDIAMIPMMLNPLLAASHEEDTDLWRRWLAVILEGISTGPRADDLPGRAPTPDQVERIIRGRKDPRARHE
jgi:AcrR family transcriptional regulator